MAISTMGGIVTALNNGQTATIPWNKIVLPTTAQVAGNWYYLGMGSGMPLMDSITGSTPNLAQQLISDSTTTTANTSSLSGNITTTTFTDTTHGTGLFTIGMMLSGGVVLPGTYITAYGTGTGNNSGGTYTINLSQTATSNTITGTGTPGNLPTGGSVSPSVKSILNLTARTAGATSCPAVLMLIDVLAAYTITSVTSTSVQTFTGSSSWPRYATGTGVQAFLVPSIVMGAGTPTVQLGYTNSGGTTSRLTPTTPSLPIITTTCPVGMNATAGLGAGKVGPFLPLQPGDLGIQSIQSIQFSATMTSGTMCLVICRPLLNLPLTSIAMTSELDTLNMIPSLPVLPDGNNLQFLMYAGNTTAVSSPIYGELQTIWG